MVYQSDYMGWFTITPPLNEAETTWLRAYAASFRDLYPDDPFGLGMNPRTEVAEAFVDVSHAPGPLAPGVPGLMCDWEPSASGTRLV